MATSRTIKINFWQDDFIQELKAEERYFYLYLITNCKTTQCGIFPISLSLMEVELALPKEKIENLIRAFIAYGKIEYSPTTKELFIVNWMRHNFNSSQSIITRIKRELKEVKNIGLIKMLYEKCKKFACPVKEIFAEFTEELLSADKEKLSLNPIPKEQKESASFTQKREKFVEERQFFEEEALASKEKLFKEEAFLVEEKKREEEKIEKGRSQRETQREWREEVQENSPKVLQKDCQETFQAECLKGWKEEYTEKVQEIQEKEKLLSEKKSYEAVIAYFQEQLYDLTPIEEKCLRKWSKRANSDLLCFAIEEAAVYSNKPLPYIRTLLNSWREKKLSTVEEVKTYQKTWKEKKNFSMKEFSFYRKQPTNSCVANADAYRYID